MNSSASAAGRPSPSSSGKKLGFSELGGYGSDSADILLVEDEKDVRKSLRRLLESLGHNVKEAASAEEGDVWLTSQRFDVCLLDVELPKMKGLEFLGWALRRDPEMAVIMLTGLDDPELAFECLGRGARTYLVKPVDAEILRLALRDALGIRRLLVERNESLPESRTEK